MFAWRAASLGKRQDSWRWGVDTVNVRLLLDPFTNLCSYFSSQNSVIPSSRLSRFLLLISALSTSLLLIIFSLFELVVIAAEHSSLFSLNLPSFLSSLTVVVLRTYV